MHRRRLTRSVRSDVAEHRARLEIQLEQAQRDPSYQALGLPELRVGTRVPDNVLEHLVALASELRAQRAKPTATPEEARTANAALRGSMRERGNYFAAIERAAADALDRVGYTGLALSQGMLLTVVARHGFTVRSPVTCRIRPSGSMRSARRSSNGCRGTKGP